MRPSEEVKAGGAAKYHAANARRGKLFAREQNRPPVDEGSFVEDGMYANVKAEGPARRWRGDRHGHDRRPARVPDGQRLHREGQRVGGPGRWKIIRIIEGAYKTGVPMVYLVDSAGARITDQVDLFPGAAARARSFTPRSRPAGRSRRCARCSDLLLPAAPTSRPSATS